MDNHNFNLHTYLLKIYTLCKFEMFLKHSQFRTNTWMEHRIPGACCANLLDQIVDAMKKTCPRYIPKSCIAPLCNEQLFVFHGNFAQRFPHGLSFWGTLQSLEEIHSARIVTILHGRAKLDQTLVEGVIDGLWREILMHRLIMVPSIQSYTYYIIT